MTENTLRRGIKGWRGWWGLEEGGGVRDEDLVGGREFWGEDLGEKEGEGWHFLLLLLL